MCTNDVFVERSRKVTVHQLVVVNGFGYDTSHKLEVAQMITVTVRRGVDCVCDTVPWRRAEQCIHRVKYLASNNDVPLSQQTSSILTILTCKTRLPVTTRAV